MEKRDSENQANTSNSPNVGSMLCLCRRRWPNTDQTLSEILSGCCEASEGVEQALVQHGVKVR